MCQLKTKNVQPFAELQRRWKAQPPNFELTLGFLISESYLETIGKPKVAKKSKDYGANAKKKKIGVKKVMSNCQTSWLGFEQRNK